MSTISSDLSLLSDAHTDLQEYTTLSNYIDAHEELEYVIAKEFVDKKQTQDLCAMVLFCKKIVNKNQNTMNLARFVRDSNNAISFESMNKDVYIAPTFEANAISFIREWLSRK